MCLSTFSIKSNRHEKHEEHWNLNFFCKRNFWWISAHFSTSPSPENSIVCFMYTILSFRLLDIYLLLEKQFTLNSLICTYSKNFIYTCFVSHHLLSHMLLYRFYFTLHSPLFKILFLAKAISFTLYFTELLHFSFHEKIHLEILLSTK